jgi:Rrf2 family protein
VRLSRESRYAILALEELMSHDDDEIVDARSLARPAKLPEAFLRKILAMLVAAGILHSYRGRGYRFARPTVAITLSQIVAAVGDDAFSGERCVFWREECSIADPCPLHFRWCDVRPLMKQIVGELSLDQISTYGG